MQLYGHYKEAGIFTIFAAVAGFFLGGWPIALTVLILGVLELSLSFDNAVINARILKNWDKKWQDRFINWGIPLAVFGMRFVFPILIVSLAASIGPIEAVKLAFTDPAQYEVIISGVHHEVIGFGAAFLTMIFLGFFLDPDKDNHWFFAENWIGNLTQWLDEHATLSLFKPLLAILIFVATGFELFPELETFVPFTIAAGLGIVAHEVIHFLADKLEGSGDDAVKGVVKAGIAGFLYLELIDASFSFDGVIAAFALTNNIAVIMLGLGIGAFFVRAITLRMVEVGTLDTYEYLENSAFWAIGTLVILMVGGLAFHIPEVVTGLASAAIIGLGWLTSKKQVIAAE